MLTRDRHVRNQSRSEKEQARFIEHVGQLVEAEGLPRIAGRMLGILMLDARTRSLDELALQLAVSRASISTNGRLLQEMGLIQRVTVPGDRRDYWRIPDPSSCLLAIGIRRMRLMHSAIREMRDVARSTSLVDSHVKQIERLYVDLIAEADGLLARWQNSLGRVRRGR